MLSDPLTLISASSSALRLCQSLLKPRQPLRTGGPLPKMRKSIYERVCTSVGQSVRGSRFRQKQGTTACSHLFPLFHFIILIFILPLLQAMARKEGIPVDTLDFECRIVDREDVDYDFLKRFAEEPAVLVKHLAFPPTLEKAFSGVSGRTRCVL